MNLLSVYDFITSCLGRAKIIGSLSYEDVPNVDKFHYTASKKTKKTTTFLNLAAYLIRKSIKYGEQSSSRWHIAFKIMIFIQDVIIATNAIRCFP